MKKPLTVIVCLVTIGGAGLLVAQSIVMSGGNRLSPFQTYDPKTRPPLTLPEAYPLAVAKLDTTAVRLGTTNRFYCVTASCLEMTNHGFTGWTFGFSNTNGQRIRVSVFFDKQTTCDIPGEGPGAVWPK